MDERLIASVLRHESADVRTLGVSILPEDRVKLLDIAGSDRAALVRAAAMRRLSDRGAKDLLLKALGSDDPFIQEAARLGLRNSLKITEIAALAGSKGLSAEERLGLLLILRESDQPLAQTVLPGFLADPDPRIRFAAIQWVGEHRLTEFRGSLQAVLASTAGTRDLFGAALAAIERLDGKKRGLEDEIAGEEYVAAMLKDARTPAPVLQQRSECFGRTIRRSLSTVSIDC